MKWLVLTVLLCFPAAAMAETASPGEKCDGLISPVFAQQFAQDWIAAWNSHDLNRILEHYSDDFEMRSPGIITVASEPSGILKGKDKVAAYWAAALKAQPNLRFELLGVYAGIHSVAINYRSVGRNLATEVLEFGAGCQVVRGNAMRGKPE